VRLLWLPVLLDAANKVGAATHLWPAKKAEKVRQGFVMLFVVFCECLLLVLLDAVNKVAAATHLWPAKKVKKVRQTSSVMCCYACLSCVTR
jgi:hypothetical protein